MGIVKLVNEVMADSPRVYWKMDEASGLPQDSSGNGFHATTKTIDAGHYNAGTPFTGAKSIVFSGSEGASRASISTATNNFSMEMWFQLQVVVGDAQFAIGNIGSGWDIEIRSTRKFRGVAFGVAVQSDSATTLTLNSWYHVVVVRDSGTWKYYLNGSVDVANAGTGTPTSASGGTMGVHGNAALQAAYSNIAIYETALSAQRVSDHYAAAQAVDFTPKVVMI